MRILDEMEVDRHGGDICFWNGKLYTGVALKPKAKGEDWTPCICVYDAETLEALGEPFAVDDGEISVCGAQNMTTDGKYIYVSHYTYDEREHTPNIVVHDKDTFAVVAKHHFGWNHGLDVVPGGKDGAVRFAWVFTPNWTAPDKDDLRINVFGVVQFVELKDGKVIDFTAQGAGFEKFIER